MKAAKAINVPVCGNCEEAGDYVCDTLAGNYPGTDEIDCMGAKFPKERPDRSKGTLWRITGFYPPLFTSGPRGQDYRMRKALANGDSLDFIRARPVLVPSAGDSDGDGLIEIRTLTDLNNMRWNLVTRWLGIQWCLAQRVGFRLGMVCSTGIFSQLLLKVMAMRLRTCMSVLMVLMGSDLASHLAGLFGHTIAGVPGTAGAKIRNLDLTGEHMRIVVTYIFMQ